MRLVLPGAFTPYLAKRQLNLIQHKRSCDVARLLLNVEVPLETHVGDPKGAVECQDRLRGPFALGNPGNWVRT